MVLYYYPGLAYNYLLFLTELSNGYELKCLCDWQHLLLILTNYSDKFCVKIVKENVHMEMIKQLIDLPRALEHQEVKLLMTLLLSVLDVVYFSPAFG